MTLIIISKKVFHGKNKGGASKHNFSLGMHGWGVFPNSKKYTTQKKEIFVKLHQNKLDQARRNREGGGLLGGGAAVPQIFAKFDLSPIDNYSEKKKVAKNI